MKPREQGDWGEMSAMQWLAFAGAQIAVPVGHTPDWDFIADFHGALIRVQSKTCRHYRDGRPQTQTWRAYTFVRATHAHTISSG